MLKYHDSPIKSNRLYPENFYFLILLYYNSMMRYKVGDKIFMKKCYKCKVDTASGIVAEPVGDQWFFNCDKCGTPQPLDQQLID